MRAKLLNVINDRGNQNLRRLLTMPSHRYLEIFLVDSWAEHLRRQERLTQSDRKLEQRLRS
jgi:hypothetical protein